MLSSNSTGRVCLVAALAILVGAAPAPAPKEQQVTLEQRKDNKAYGKSAYSFRTASQDVTIHKNYIDVLFNGCGQLHVRPYTGATSRIVDLGAIKLADATLTPPADAKWFEQSVTPVVGDVYLEEIADEDQKMTVAFRVDALAGGSLKLTWVTLKPMEGEPMDPHHGAAGTHGQCGGHHASK